MEAALIVTIACRPALQSLTQECLYFRGRWEESDTRSLQHCRQLERALKLCKGYVSKKEMKFLNFFKAKKGRERNRFIVLVGYSTGCRTKLASLLSNVIIGILSFHFLLFFSSSFPSLLFPPPSPFSSSSSSYFYCNNPHPTFCSKSFSISEPGIKSYALEIP